jgi:hypothetical protein
MIRTRKLIQLWTRRIEAFLLDVMMGKRHGPRASFARALLWASFKIFKVMVRVRGALYGHAN